MNPKSTHRKLDKLVMTFIVVQWWSSEQTSIFCLFQRNGCEWGSGVGGGTSRVENLNRESSHQCNDVGRRPGEQSLGFLSWIHEKRRLVAVSTLKGREATGRTQRRPVSISWFSLSVCPLDCGWNPEDRITAGHKRRLWLSPQCPR